MNAHSYPLPSTGQYIPAPFTNDEIQTFNKLTHKQRLFVEEYLMCLDAKTAAEAAGYDKQGAGSRLLKKGYIVEAIEIGFERKLTKRRVSKDDVLDELCKIGFFNYGKFLHRNPNQENSQPWLDLSTATADDTAAMKSYTVKEYSQGRGENKRDIIETKVEMYDKLAALQKIGDHLGMFKNQLELSGPEGGPIQIESIEIIGIESGTFLTAAIGDDGVARVT